MKSLTQEVVPISVVVILLVGFVYVCVCVLYGAQVMALQGKWCPVHSPAEQMQDISSASASCSGHRRL